MTTFPGSPRPLKGGLVLINAETGVVQRIIALQPLIGGAGKLCTRSL
jgi:hypothetical protein